MRRAPDNTLSKLTAYDPDLDLVWDGEIARWYLTYRRRRVCALYHDDGTPWINLDGAGDELVRNVRRMDTAVDGPERLRAMARAAAEARYRGEQRKRNALTEARAHGAEIGEVWRRGGPKPFVHLNDNPLAATAAAV